MSSRSIKRLRTTLRLTQRAAAALVHVSPNTWARWERGESKPRGLLHRQLIAELPLAARGRRSNRRPVRSHPSLPPTLAAKPRLTGASLQKFLGTLDKSGLSGPRPKYQRNPAKAPSKLADPNRAEKFRSTGATWLKFAGTWVGDDAERCLELVHATRGLAKF